MWESTEILAIANTLFTVFMVFWIVVVLTVQSKADTIIQNQRANLTTAWYNSYERWRKGMFWVGWLACVAAVVKLFIESGV